MPGKKHPGCPPMDTQHNERQTQMTDILERLQYMFFRFGKESETDADNRRIQTAKDAADEIEKLRAALIEINDLNAKRIGYSKKIERVIWEALGEKE
jgi:hypothetical protein